MKQKYVQRIHYLLDTQNGMWVWWYFNHPYNLRFTHFYKSFSNGIEIEYEYK